MKIDDVRKTAFAMPLTSPSFPPGPYRFVNREFLIVTYRTDPDTLRAVVPEPLEIEDPIVKYEFIRMPDSTGFGDYTESGQVIPVVFNGKRGGYVHSMYLNDDAPIAGGRELWGFPKKLASPALGVEKDTLLGTLDYGPVRVATATMGYKHRALEPGPVREALMAPSFLLKIIPHVDGTPRICELVRYYLEDVDGQRRLDRSRRPGARAPRAGAGSATAGAGGHLGHPRRERPHPRPRYRGLRLSRPNSRSCSMKLKDRICIITGAASGIGKEIALTFAAEGGKVAIADLDRDAAHATAAQIAATGASAMGIAMNVADEAQVNAGIDEVVRAWGGVDVLVSNAGIQIIHPLEAFPFADWKRLLAIHLDGAFLTTKACLPHMYASGRGGSVIYMGSVHSKEASVLKAAYVTAKHGLVGLAEVVAKEGAAPRRTRQCHLPRVRAHAPGGQADPRAGEGPRHLRSAGDQECHAEGHRGRRVHDHAGRGRGRAAVRELSLQRVDRPVARGQPRLVHAIGALTAEAVIECHR